MASLYSQIKRKPILSPDVMDAIDNKVAELKHKFDNDCKGMETSDEDRETLGYIQFHERMQTFEPFRLYQFQVTDLMKRYNVIEWSRDELSNYKREEDRRLREFLLINWKKLSLEEKIVFHSLNGTLPYHGCMYYPPEQWIENAKEWISKKL